MPTPTPQYRLIVLPVDGADESRNAAAQAAYIAALSGAAVAVLGVIDMSAGFSFSAADAEEYDRRRAEAQAAIEAAGTIVRGAGVRRVEHLIMDGIPHEAVLEVAAEQGADMIVVRAGGEMPGYLARQARCPVLIVPKEGRG